MGGEDNAGVSGLSRARGHQAHEAVYFPVLYALQAIQPDNLMLTKGGFYRPEFLTVIVIGANRRAGYLN